MRYAAATPSLRGKRVLLIAPRFFGYEEDIKNELKRRGAKVDFVIDRPFESPLMKAVTRIRRNWVMPAANRYYDSAMSALGRSDYDLVLVVNGQTLSQETLLRLRTSFPTAEFILYMWDSARNRRSSVQSMRLFDRALTFDPHDARQYGMSFRPLFYGPGFSAREDVASDLALSFVGTIHTDRYAVLSSVLGQVPQGLDTFTYLYLQAPWVFHLQRLGNPAFRGARIDDFAFDPLPKIKVQEVFGRSRAVLDIEHPHQRGLTMRTLETFGARKKLITTNRNIADYDFFTDANIHIIDRANPQTPKSFFTEPYSDVSRDLYYKYSIEGWLDDVLGLSCRDRATK